MKRIKVSAPRLALTGLACFLAAISWAAIEYHLLLAQMQKDMASRVSQLRQLPSPSSYGSTPLGYMSNSEWVSSPRLDLALLLGLAGLALFVGAPLFALGKIIHRRLTHR